jgi:hypothetical protein
MGSEHDDYAESDFPPVLAPANLVPFVALMLAVGYFVVHALLLSVTIF